MRADGSDFKRPGATNPGGNNRVPAETGNPSLEQWFVQNQKSIESLLPEHVSFRRFARLTVQVLYENPQILGCEPGSIVFAIKEAARKGLEPDGRKACIVPYKSGGIQKAEFQTMYQGELELAYRTGEYEVITAKVVHENDYFQYEYGLNPNLKHIPADTNRGKPVRYYGMYKLKTGGYDFVVMSREEIEQHRDQFSKAYNKHSGTSTWENHFDSMALKTVLLGVTKYAPKSVERYFSAADGMRNITPEELAPKQERPANIPTLPGLNAAPKPAPPMLASGDCAPGDPPAASAASAESEYAETIEPEPEETTKAPPARKRPPSRKPAGKATASSSFEGQKKRGNAPPKETAKESLRNFGRTWGDPGGPPGEETTEELEIF